MCEYFSNCCTYPPDERFSFQRTEGEYEDIMVGICSQCKEWAVFIEEGDNDE